MRPSLVLLALAVATTAAPPEPRFRAVTIDDKIQIGYGVAVADVDGDGRPDVILADKRQIVWYRNPAADKASDPAAWSKFVIAENLTEKDNVCLAAQDLDGDGKCEIAVGAEWNPADTEKSGAVFYLIPPADRTQRWEPVKFPAVEPTTHRMRWLKLEDGKWGLVVVPLHGRGNKNGEGAPVKVLLYHPPADLHGEWKSEVVDESMHMTHNFLPLKTGVLLAGKEGAPFVFRDKGSWQKWIGLPRANPIHPPAGAGEIDYLEVSLNHGFTATIEPMHGNQVVVYDHDSRAESRRHVLTDRLLEGHALRCGSLGGGGDEQIVVGWRGNPSKLDVKVGVALWSALDKDGAQWRETPIDDGGMACEDLQLADLNADGRLDIIASGRATKNVKIYFNETAR